MCPHKVGFGCILLTLALLGAACIQSAPAAEAPYVYAAVGASDTVGYGAHDPHRDGWPSVFRRAALPPGTRMVNLGIGGVTTAQALVQEVPTAVAAEPRLATVWLAINDLFRLVPVATYERNLERVVHRLRRGGETQVLVANVPPVERLPVVRACLAEHRTLPGCPLPIRVPTVVVQRAVERYNDAIARVAKREGAVLVDLYSVGRAAARDGSELSLISGDGLHPSDAGHRRIAAAFAHALRTSPRTRSLGGD
jgi:lysophospholipase L1-like esterase